MLLLQPYCLLKIEKTGSFGPQIQMGLTLPNLLGWPLGVKLLRWTCLAWSRIGSKSPDGLLFSGLQSLGGSLLRTDCVLGLSTKDRLSSRMAICSFTALLQLLYGMSSNSNAAAILMLWTYPLNKFGEWETVKGAPEAFHL